MNHGWQSEFTDGPKGGWSQLEWCFLKWLQWLQPQLLDVVWCSAAVLVLVVYGAVAVCNVISVMQLQLQLWCRAMSAV